MEPTDVGSPDYFHKVVDCQWACPAHTPVPEYIRLISAGRYADAYMINWRSNVFPGVLGRTCDRPCEPACRRGRVEEEPVAICRLKRVAADNKGDVSARMPRAAANGNGKRIACIGAGPASLTVARDLSPLGYEVTIFDDQTKAGGFIRSQIPRFRLPEEVIDEEVKYITDLGPIMHMNHRVDSLKSVLDQGYDAVFVGAGAPRGRDLGQCRHRARGTAHARRPQLRPGPGQRQWPRHGARPKTRLRPRRHARAHSGAGRHAQRRLRRGRRHRGGAGSNRGGLTAPGQNRGKFPIGKNSRFRRENGRGCCPTFCGWRAHCRRLHSSSTKRRKQNSRRLRMGRQEWASR